jgi:predicted enzyme related to lactoylglutathione lyase
MSNGVDDRVARPAGISYLQIPSADARRACEFYRAVFGWDADGDRFTDGTGHVIGHFVQDRPPAEQAGIRPYVFVANLDATLALVTSHGGTVAEPPYAEGDLRVATFRDPFGNVLGVWQATASD